MVAVGKPAVFVSDMKIFDVFQFFFMNKGIIDVINAFRVAIHTDCWNTFLAVVFVFDAVINASEMHLVQKFKHTGMVQIILDEGKDLFEIHLIPDSEGERKIIEDVYFDMLVSIIDENVEKTDDYEKRISDTYDIIRY